MPKTSREQILQDENKVLNELQKNSKESIDKIAKKCGFSRQKVWRIIKRMEENKMIWGYTAVVDDDKLGVKKFLILVKRMQQPVTDEYIDKVIHRDLKKEIKEVGARLECSYYVHGSYDYVVCLTAKNIKQVKQFCERFNKLFYKHIAELKVLEIIFPVERCGISNPNVKDLKKLFDIK
jgi:Lrp/AsnC family leucine-responsive transcriptional regulator